MNAVVKQPVPNANKEATPKRIARTSRVRRGLKHIISAAEAYATAWESDASARPATGLTVKDMGEMKYALGWCREQAELTDKRSKSDSGANTEG